MELFNLPELVPLVQISWGGPKLPDNLVGLEVERAGLALCLGLLQCEIPLGLTLLINKKTPTVQ